ncbi:MAG TPA: hypothetical protein PLN05_04190 [Pyrinomonadaceae bacterium]|nr:hypothetical protein [Chloracidobacterium sp.]HBE83814.1 hypothetical protein [Blastocatellia bacterium]HRJ89966.1 hypothetical protein [Pyrinomonadaceae bacterium]HRK49622.1 hypothetical protein [Pyrinomonadaceae bacterium]
MDSDSEIAELTKRIEISRSLLRSLSPEAKIVRLMNLQEQYYEMLAVHEANGGKPIPAKWKKWHAARHP